MNVAGLGDSGLTGRVHAGKAAATAGHLVLVSEGGDSITVAAALHLDSEHSGFVRVWTRELPRGGRQSTVLADGGLVYLLSGDERLLLGVRTGEVLAEATGPVGAGAAIVDSELVVPEGQQLAGYDARTLSELWRRALPEVDPAHEGLWFGPVGDGACGVNAGAWRCTEPTMVGLWPYASDQFVEIRAAPRISSSPVRVGDAVVVSGGGGYGGPGDRLIAVSADDGSVLWRVPTPPQPDPHLFKPPNIRWGWPSGLNPIEPTLLPYGECVIAATQEPSVQARIASTGELLWRVRLTEERFDPVTVVPTEGGTELLPVVQSQPTALAVVGETVVVAMQDQRLVAVDAATGENRGEARIPGGDHAGPAAVVTPMRADKGRTSALGITSFNGIFSVTL